MDSTILINSFQKLPLSAQQEVLDFIEFISKKYMGNKETNKKKSVKTQKFKFEWEGAISEYNKQYTSVELQHKASEWRGI